MTQDARPAYDPLNDEHTEEVIERAHARLEDLIAMLQAGHTRKEIAELTGFSHAYTSHAILVLGLQELARRDGGRWSS